VEERRAREVDLLLGPKDSRSPVADFIFDLHNTTSNTGIVYVSTEMQVSFVKEPSKTWAVFQKRPDIVKSLLIVFDLHNITSNTGIVYVLTEISAVLSL